MNNEKEWNIISQTPPDKLVEVVDGRGNKAFAQPTYFPFDVVKMPGDEAKPWGWRGTVVHHENAEMKWDGGWMIKAVGITPPEIGAIIAWREINEN